MPNIVTVIPTMTDEGLLNLFRNAIEKIAQGANDTAASIKVAVEREWKRRSELARTGLYIPERPKIGMLATLGYRVGATNGEKTEIRRQILVHLIEGELPMVESPAYTNEWGKPNSPKRVQKLVHFFSGHLNNRAHSNNAKAMIEWAQDLEWVQKNYKHLARYPKIDEGK